MQMMLLEHTAFLVERDLTPGALAGLGPAIHAFPSAKSEGVDGHAEHGHDDSDFGETNMR